MFLGKTLATSAPIRLLALNVAESWFWDGKRRCLYFPSTALALKCILPRLDEQEVFCVTVFSLSSYNHTRFGMLQLPAYGAPRSQTAIKV
jgi:hypothetical protein